MALTHRAIGNSRHSNNATSPSETSLKWMLTVLKFKRADLTAPIWMAHGTACCYGMKRSHVCCSPHFPLGSHPYFSTRKPSSSSSLRGGGDLVNLSASPVSSFLINGDFSIAIRPLVRLGFCLIPLTFLCLCDLPLWFGDCMQKVLFWVKSRFVFSLLRDPPSLRWWGLVCLLSFGDQRDEAH